MESVTKVAHLLKTGGVVAMEVLESANSWVIAGRTIDLNPISRELLREALESAGLSQIKMEIQPCESLQAKDLDNLPGLTSLMLVVATKAAD